METLTLAQNHFTISMLPLPLKIFRQEPGTGYIFFYLIDI